MSKGTVSAFSSSFSISLMYRFIWRTLPFDVPTSFAIRGMDIPFRSERSTSRCNTENESIFSS
ncbi:MAG: hypothetical protein IJ558_06735 [Treponema sp.]|nr:hypothetical protein [Treponema sp.]